MNKDKGGIIVGLSGGLGNQMFQYAMGRALSLRHDVPLFLDLSGFEGTADRMFALKPFISPPISFLTIATLNLTRVRGEKLH